MVSRKGLLLSRPGDGAIGRAVVQRLNVGYIGAPSATRIDIEVDWECNTDAQKEFLGEGKMQPRYEVLDRRDARAGDGYGRHDQSHASHGLFPRRLVWRSQ